MDKTLPKRKELSNRTHARMDEYEEYFYRSDDVSGGDIIDDMGYSNRNYSNDPKGDGESKKKKWKGRRGTIREEGVEEFQVDVEKRKTGSKHIPESAKAIGSCRTSNLFPKRRDVLKVKKGIKKNLYIDKFGRIYKPTSTRNILYKSRNAEFSAGDPSFLMMDVALQTRIWSKESPLPRYEEKEDIQLPEPMETIELFHYDGSSDIDRFYGTFEIVETISNSTNSGYVILDKMRGL